jgi:Lon protease-like protein
MELRLFPLRTVLFPGMPLPLQVFEERYRQLVSECVDASEPFGVALIREGEEVGAPAVPHSLGTTARIESVDTDAAGRLALRTVGERRFRIVQLHHDRPYLWADVEFPTDEVAAIADSLVEQARDRYAALVQLRLAAGGEYQRHVPTPDRAGELADAIGAILRSPADELQRLLETIDTGQRLERAAELLEPAIAVARREVGAAVARRRGGVANLN